MSKRSVAHQSVRGMGGIKGTRSSTRGFKQINRNIANVKPRNLLAAGVFIAVVFGFIYFLS